MSSLFRTLLLATLSLCATIAVADEYDDTISLFKKAGESAAFFENSYAYAVLPTVGKGGIGVGAAHGNGRAFVNDEYVGDVTMNQVSVGLQAVAVGMTPLPATNSPRTPHTSPVGEHTLVPSSSTPRRVVPW